MKATGGLPRLSARLGVLTRTNSEAILGAERARFKGEDYSRGVAITSSFFPDDETHIEPVRYGRGSNEMGSLRTLLVDGGGGTPRWAKFLGRVATHPLDLAKVVNLRHWSERAVIALVMQNRDNSVTVRSKRGRLGWGMRSGRGHGEQNPVWIPDAHRATRMLAEEIGGTAFGTWTDLFNIPMTAHFLGGCAIGDSPGDRGDRPLPPGLRVRGTACRRRFGRLGQPRREPGAHDHHSGRAGDGDVAEPRRSRPAARCRRAVPAGGAGRPEQPRRPCHRARRPAPATREQEVGA